MFTRWTSAKARIILEIPADIARTVLTSNRDGLRHKFQEEFDRYLEKLSIDCNSSVKERFSPQKTYFGRATRTVRRQASQAAATAREVPEIDAVPVPYRATPSFEPRLGPPTTVNHNDAAESIPPFVIYTDCQSRKLRAAAKRFTANAIAGTKHERLLAGWTCACEIALDALLSLQNREYFEFETGFVFSDEAKAVCLSSDGVHSLLLRPVDESGSLAFNISSSSTAFELLAIAAHEAAHAVHSCHNEDFASTLTGIFGRIAGKSRSVRNALRRPNQRKTGRESRRTAEQPCHLLVPVS